MFWGDTSPKTGLGVAKPGGRGAICAPLLPSCTSINFFGEPLHAPKWCFFNPVVILGLKKHHFGARAGTRKKSIEVQDKNRAKKGGTPLFEVILGHFGHLLGFPVKTLCNHGLPGNPSQQRKRYTTHRGSSQRSFRGSILHSLRV